MLEARHLGAIVFASASGYLFSQGWAVCEYVMLAKIRIPQILMSSPFEPFEIVRSGSGVRSAVFLFTPWGMLRTVPTILVSLLTYRWYLRWSYQRAVLRGDCPFCSYNLTGNVSGTCPECGRVINGMGK